jgi:hypothetical protein
MVDGTRPSKVILVKIENATKLCRVILLCISNFKMRLFFDIKFSI